MQATIDAPMYVLGQLCRELYGSDMPDNVRRAIYLSPRAGLAKAMHLYMTKHQPTEKSRRDAAQDRIGYLVNKLSAVDAQWPAQASHAEQGTFLGGYYAYMTGEQYSARLGPEQLRMAGEALYGEQWQSEMTRALGLSDSRRVRQWMAPADSSSYRRIPAGIWADVAVLLRQRSDATQQVLARISA